MILKKLAQEEKLVCHYEGQTIKYSISIGLANFPESGEDIDTLLNHADQCMYEDKKRQKNLIKQT